MDLFKKTAFKRTIFFIFWDIAIIAFSVWFSFVLRFDGNIPQTYYPLILRIIALAIVFVIPIFYFQKLYSFSWSYVSANELISLFKGITVAFIFLGTTLFISNYFPRFINFPRSTIFISYFLIFIFCSLSRFLKRVYFHLGGFRGAGNKDRTLIVGAGDAGEQIVRNMLSSKKFPYLPIGFVDDNPIKRGVKIHGLKVLGAIDDIPNVVKSHHVKQLIIAIPSADNTTIKKAVGLGKQAGLYKIKIAPSLSELIRNEISVKSLRDVDVEDLLGREAITLDKKQIEQFIKDKVVLITGAAGSIGSELSRQVAKVKPRSLIMLDQDETGIFHISKELEEKFPEVPLHSLVLDICDQEKIREVFRVYKPHIVFHAAAYKHVPLMEKNIHEAVKNNIFGTQSMASASVEHGVEKFIFISTDKAVNPTSVMGTTKRVGEMICAALSQEGKTHFISVRFGNVLNSRGSVIPIFKEQIRKGGPVQVTHPDMTRYFMLTSEACLLVMQAGAMGRGGEVFVLDMGKPVKIVDLAKEMIKLSGFEPDRDIAIVFIGARPGEKLFEEILTAEEGVVSTQNKKIYIARLSQTDGAELKSQLEKLKEMGGQSDGGAIREILKNLVPHSLL